MEDELVSCKNKIEILTRENTSLHDQLSIIAEGHTNLSATESELGHLAAASDISDQDVESQCEADSLTHVSAPCRNCKFLNVSFDSLDYTKERDHPDSRTAYIPVKDNLGSQDFQESGIFEGTDEDLKHVSEATQTTWGLGMRGEDKESVNIIEQISDVNSFKDAVEIMKEGNTKGVYMLNNQNKLEPIVLRRLSPVLPMKHGPADMILRHDYDAVLSRERKISNDCERLKSANAQLELCIDCLRLQLEGGTPCYPLGKGFQDILDEVRHLQEQNKKLNRYQEAAQARIEELSQELNKCHEKLCQTTKDIEESEKIARLQVQR